MSDLKNFFMGISPKDEPTAKNLVWNKSSSHSRKKTGKIRWGHPPLAIGGLISNDRYESPNELVFPYIALRTLTR